MAALTAWVDLNRNDSEYWELGITKVLRSIERQKRRKGNRDRHDVQTEAARILGQGEHIVRDEPGLEITASEGSFANPVSRVDDLSTSLTGSWADGAIEARSRRPWWQMALCYLVVLASMALAYAAAHSDVVLLIVLVSLALAVTTLALAYPAQSKGTVEGLDAGRPLQQVGEQVGDPFFVPAGIPHT